MSANIMVHGSGSREIQVRLRAVSVQPSLEFEVSFTAQPGSEVEVRLRRISGSLSPGVKSFGLRLRWSFKTDASSGPLPFLHFDTTNTQIFQVLNYKPGAPEPYDLALKYACRYVAGQEDAALRICEGVAGELKYDPGGVFDDAWLDVYSESKRKPVDCDAHAAVMEILCQAVGIDAQTWYVWGGEPDERVPYRYIRGEQSLATMQLAVPPKDLAWQNPHFLLHVLVATDTRFFDPSYGTAGLPKVMETEPGVGCRHGNHYPLLGKDSGWECPHARFSKTAALSPSAKPCRKA